MGWQTPSTAEIKRRVAAWVDCEHNQRRAAIALGCSQSTLSRTIAFARDQGLIKELPRAAYRLLSEDESKFDPNASETDCILDLRAMAEADPDRIVSRNNYRIHGKYSEATWNKFFGTFEQFKQRAGLKLSSGARRLELAISRHSAADVLRQMNVEKQGWDGKYLNPNPSRWKTGLVGTDVHDKECDPFWRRLFIETARRVQPDFVCLNGDIFDLPEFSKYSRDPREWDLIGRINWVHQFLADIRTASPSTEIWFIEGNHEFRLLRHLAEESPGMRTILSDLHGFTVPKLLGLDKYQVNYVSRTDLAAWTERDISSQLRQNYYQFHGAVIGHHFPEGRKMGYPGWNGHHHSHEVWHAYSPQFGPYEWHQLGSGHRRDASYMAGEKWSTGFLLAHIDSHTKRTQFEYLQLHDHAVIGGQWYTREASEIIVPQGV